MKKYSITLLIILVFFIIPTKADAQVNWDGSEIVKGQTGKMTFTKDVKVYKQNADGTYSSMVVKRNHYFRVYNIEKYDQKTFYWMSSGYRIQATDLVRFKEIPAEIRASFYSNPAYIVINRQGTTAYLEEKYPSIDFPYGKHLLSENRKGSYYFTSHIYFINGKLSYSEMSEGFDATGVVDGTDIRIVETTTRDTGYYTLLTDSPRLIGPIVGAEAPKWRQPAMVDGFYSFKDTKNYSKGTPFQSLGIEINGYLRVQSLDGSIGYIPFNRLQPITHHDKRYIRYGVVANSFGTSERINLKRFDEVLFYTENEITALIEVNGKMYTIPKSALAIKMPNESPVIAVSFLPNDKLQKLEYKNTLGDKKVYKRVTNNRFEAGDHTVISYNETEQAFHFEIDGSQYLFEKPIKEGSKIIRGTDNEGYVRAIHYSIKTPAGTFENVVETSFDQFFAPGYGLIEAYDKRLLSY
ncbi:hypothetical protein [Lysinibacillus piscis]|uniref:WG repeat-containing protein n=1 Tax=Lysinibacillus piscis TaxID=2518931 RepID=A0ABQ5NIK5_9BACI|nr:hypothetical protein [Lysinibacillus sp. KH24]GLC88210.1 hypothetical protein LYSBPC_13370 [Lysinibacillus sp. KH24]